MMERMSVIVPDGLNAGDEFVVAAHGQEFSVAVPDGVNGGMEIELELPVPTTTERCVVTVPAGIKPGEAFTIGTTWGSTFEIVAPGPPGMEIEVELPLPPPSDPPYNIPLPPPPNAGQGGIAWDQWDDGDGEREHGRATASSAATGTHAVGARVQVQRTNGMWSPAVIKEYDEVSDTYTVELQATQQLKYLVSDNELMPIDFKAQVCGEHFVGRRVMVPCVGAESKDDVMGEVRAFEEATGLYTVALDSGLVKRGLKADAIRVGRDRKVGGGLEAKEL